MGGAETEGSHRGSGVGDAEPLGDVGGDRCVGEAGVGACCGLDGEMCVVPEGGPEGGRPQGEGGWDEEG